MFSESHYRTVMKVISWRVILTTSHIINAFIATGSLLFGLQIAGAAAIINSFLFWIHERIWNRFSWKRTPNEKIKFEEKNIRSISKIISWRILITASNFLIPFVITGSFGSAVIFAGLATVVNMVIFWAHERIWNYIKFGKEINDNIQS